MFFLLIILLSIANCFISGISIDNHSESKTIVSNLEDSISYAFNLNNNVSKKVINNSLESSFLEIKNNDLCSLSFMCTFSLNFDEDNIINNIEMKNYTICGKLFSVRI